MEKREEKDREERAEAWRRLRENQQKRKEGREKTGNIKIIFMFALMIVVFIILFLLLQFLMKEDVSLSQKENGKTIQIELR